MSATNRKLRVFLCHASQDKPIVHELYQRLLAEGWIDPWLDEEKLLPGQDWDMEIYKATRDADAIIICFSKASVTKEGYVNKEIRRALSIAEEKPEGAIYIIPLRLDDCISPFEQLKKIRWVDYFTKTAYEELLHCLKMRFSGLDVNATVKLIQEPILQSDIYEDLDFNKFIEIPRTIERTFFRSVEKIPYSFHIGKYPVTNVQYERFLNASDFAEKSFWTNFPKFNEDCTQIGSWSSEGWDWLQNRIITHASKPIPSWWDDKEMGIAMPDNPVCDVTWYEANAYCNWLRFHWDELSESRSNAELSPKQIRLPLDIEWSAAAGGESPKERFPWDLKGKKTRDEKEIAIRANVAFNVGVTTPVNSYPRGSSPYGVMDMAGNVLEWQANYRDMEKGYLSVRGGSFHRYAFCSHVSFRSTHPDLPDRRDSDYGFRVIVLENQ